MDIQQIKELLINDKIHYSDAFELIKKLPKIWSTKQWKENRSKKIGSYCETCGSSESLVIQHTKQPIEFRIIYSSKMNELFSSELNDLSNLDSELGKQKEVRLACDLCRRVSIRVSKNGEYSCTCGNKFKTPIQIIYYKHCRTTDENAAIESVKRFILSQNNNKVKKLNDREIGRLALIDAISEHEIYLSMEHTKTLCKKHAFIEDYAIIK